MTIVFILAILIIAGLFAMSYFGDSSPTYHRPPSQTANTIKWVGVGLLSGVSFLLLSIFLGVALAAIGGGFFALGKGLRAFRESRTNATDPKGFRPAYMEDVAPWWKRLFGFRDFYWQDWDRIKSAAGRVRISPLGNVIAETIDYGASDDEQMLLNRENLRARQIAAGKKTEGKYEVMDRAGLLPYAVSKAGLIAQGLLPGKQQPAQAAQAALPAPVQSVLTLADAMKPAIAGDIIFGQEPDGVRGLAVYRPADDYHISLLGSSGYGKSTNTAWAILLGFLRMGGIAAVAEPEGAAQFAEVQPWAEWARLDGAGLTRHAEAIHREFQRRGDEMTRRGAGHFSDIPANERAPHLLAIFEEYPKARTQAAKAGTLADFDAIMGEIAQDAGKTGIHLLLIAQHFHPTDGQPWPVTVRDNCGFRISYNQPGNDSTKTLGGLYELSALEKGQFAHRGKVYNGYHARPEFARILANVPKRSGPGILDARPVPVSGQIIQPATVDPDRSVRRVRPPSPTPPHRSEDGTNSPANSSSEQPANSQAGQWDEFARQFFKKNPAATQTALTKAMADVDPEGRHPRSFMGGLSYDLFHAFSPAGNNYQPHGWPSSAKPDKLSHLDTTDIFGHHMTVLDADNPDDAAELERIRQEIAAGNFDIRSKK